MGVLKMSEYEDFQKKIHIQFDELVGSGINWLAPARVLKIDVVEFIMLLKNDYKAEISIYRKEDGGIKFVAYKWSSLVMARKFKNYINKVARENRITLVKLGGV